MGEAILLTRSSPGPDTEELENDIEFGNRIVLDNLVVYVDATNPESYPGTGTTWFDLSGNNYHFNLLNGASFVPSDPSIDIGNGRRANTTTLPAQFVGNPNLTISMWIKRTGNNNSSQGTWGIGGGSTYRGICSWYNNLTDRISLDVWSGGTYVAPVQYPLNQWAFVTFQKIAGAMTTTNTILWLNETSYTGGQLTVSRSNTVTPDISNLNNFGMTIGEHLSTNSASYLARFAEVMFYNRVLSPQEVLQNFNATKSKYGL